MKFYILSFFLLFAAFSSSPGCRQDSNAGKPDAAKIVFRSSDGGQTWQDVSEGLPASVQDTADIPRDTFYANEKGLYLTEGTRIYHNSTVASTPFWTSEIVPFDQNRTATIKSGTYKYKYWGANVKKADGTDIWSQLFEYNIEPRIRTAFETASGAVFIGTNEGFFKTADNGNSWKHVFTGGLVGNLAEGNGVLLATSMYKIIRSTDDGENWTEVNSDTSAFDVKQINGGFAAITAAAVKAQRRLMTSYDGGKTWQHLENKPQYKELNDSIWKTWNDRPRLKATNPLVTPLGEDLYCIHPKGIFKSTDNGKKWKLILPAVKDKVFSLFVSGEVIYAVARKGGC